MNNNTKDINLHESGSGGEMAIISNDLLIGETLYQQVYLALFGGNIEASTRGDEPFGNERFDWWGNSLFFAENPNKQFNSETEKTITNLVLNSSGRLRLLQAVNSDLEYLNELLDYEVEVFFNDYNRVKIEVKFKPKGTQENKVLQLVYDNAKNELIINKII